ncbi:MAG: hypothetical protein CMN93_07845, partial [Synechococcus sp. CPC35]|nr:hypothetical protein [Synechococcus sp. CPC35]
SISTGISRATSGCTANRFEFVPVQHPNPANQRFDAAWITAMAVIRTMLTFQIMDTGTVRRIRVHSVGMIAAS